MIIENIGNPILESYIFFAILVIGVLITTRLKRTESGGISLDLTNELKGWATILVVTSHIGYFLFANHRFLYPLSNIAGVGVDLFLFLSGFGLAVTSYKKLLSTWEFYKKRLIKIFIPLWISLIIFLVVDKLLLGQTYEFWKVVKAFLGIFQTADIYKDINSPLWYLTLILFYYLTFPFVFSRERPGLSAALWFFIGFCLTNVGFGFYSGVNHLYTWHIAAFPLGIYVAGLFNNTPRWLSYLVDKINFMRRVVKPFGQWFLRVLTLLVLLYLIGYWMINPGVGGSSWLVQAISVGAVVVTILFAWEKPVRFGLLELLGKYSYEIYLLHWPLLYRYDFILRYLPAGVAVALGFVWIVAVSFAVHYLSEKINQISLIKVK